MLLRSVYAALVWKIVAPMPGTREPSVTLKLMLSKTLSTSARSSKLTRPAIATRLVTPRSTRVKNGARSNSVRGAQSPA